MKVAISDWDLAFPLNSGKRIRTTNLMLELAKRHQVTYVSRGSDRGAAGRASREFLGDHGIQTHYIDSPIPSKSGLGFPFRLLRNVTASNLPYVVDVHCSSQFRRRYREYAAEQNFDLWQLEWTPYSTMLDNVSGLRRVLVAHNVDSLIWQRYAETETRPLHRQFFKRQADRFKSFEAASFRGAERVVAVSEPDAQLMRSMFQIDHVDVVDNGVDITAYGAIQRRPVAGEILFLGSLDWRPNQDAIELLLRRIFPEVRRQCPDAVLKIVGRRANASLQRQAASMPGVELHVDVPDVFPYLASAEVMAIPLRIGGGSRLKMIEAMAARVPVVASTIAAEGLHLTPDRDFILADTPEQMVMGLLRLMGDHDQARSMVHFGRQSVEQRYGWDRLATQLEQSWEACLRGRPVKASDQASTTDAFEAKEVTVV